MEFPPRAICSHRVHFFMLYRNVFFIVSLFTFVFRVFYDGRKTTIALVCDETEEGRVDPMRNVFASNLFVSTLTV